jgi:hypothetical protein
MLSKREGNSELPSNTGWFFLLVRALLLGVLALLRDGDRTPSPGPPQKGQPQGEVLAQFHAAEYASERNSVDVWKTLQYALIPIIFVAWPLLAQIRDTMNPVVFCWVCAAVLPLCYIAYQKAMVDALTGVLLIEEHVRPRAIELAGTDEFWFHEPIYRRDVKPDVAYGWYWPPLLSFASPLAGLVYRVATAQPFASRDWWHHLDGYGDLLGYGLCCVAAWFVGDLSKQGLALNRKIDAQIRRRRSVGYIVRQQDRSSIMSFDKLETLHEGFMGRHA